MKAIQQVHFFGKCRLNEFSSTSDGCPVRNCAVNIAMLCGESSVGVTFYVKHGVSWNNAAAPELYEGTSAGSKVPGPKQFVYIASQNATLFRRPTEYFCTLSIRRKSQGSNAKRPLTREQKIASLRAVLKRNVAQAKHVEYVDEPEGVEVKPSLINGAGKGLFATKHFSKGDILCTYYGTKKSLFQMLRSDNTDYMVGGFGFVAQSM